MSNRYTKSKIVPYYFKAKSDHYQIGDKLERCITIIRMPQFFQEAILSAYLNSDYRISMTVNGLNHFSTKFLSDEIYNKDIEIEAQTDLDKKFTLQKEKQSLIDTLDRITSRRDTIFNVTINIFVTGDNLEELERKTSIVKRDFKGFDLLILPELQEEMFKESSPYFIESNLNQLQKKYLGIPLTSESVAALWPFIFSSLEDFRGTLLGYEMNTYGKFIFNPFLYKDDPGTAVAQNRLNGNIIIKGTSGAGKSVLMMLILFYEIMRGRKVIHIDPENMNQAFANYLGAHYIDWQTNKEIINIFDLKPISTDEEEPLPDELMYDTTRAINNVIEEIKFTAKYISPDITSNELNLLGELIPKAYDLVGISKFNSFKHITNDQYPTFTTLMTIIDDELQSEKKNQFNSIRMQILENLQYRIMPFINEYAEYFNGHTTLDEKSRFLFFGVKFLNNMTEGLKNALMRLIYTKAWSLCLDKSEYTVFEMDEANAIFKVLSMAELGDQFVRRSRKYNNITILTSQNIADDSNQYGESMFNNCAYKFIMNSGEKDVAKLAEYVELNDTERYIITNLGRGQAMVFIGNNIRIGINILATDAQRKLMNNM